MVLQLRAPATPRTTYNLMEPSPHRHERSSNKNTNGDTMTNTASTHDRTMPYLTIWYGINTSRNPSQRKSRGTNKSKKRARPGAITGTIARTRAGKRATTKLFECYSAPHAVPTDDGATSNYHFLRWTSNVAAIPCKVLLRRTTFFRKALTHCWEG